MFFGLEIKGSQNQAKPITLANTLKLSQAVLDPSKLNGKKEPVSVVAEYNKKQFVLCVLDPNLSWQCPLDLLFEGGSQVKFFLRGNGAVHLTGYENFDDMDDMSMSVSSEDALSSDEEDKVAVAKVKPKPKAKANNKAKVNGNAKPLVPKVSGDDDLDDDSDSDDEDFEMDDDALMDADELLFDEEDDDDEEDAEDEDDDDDGDEEDEEEESDDE